MRSEKIVYKSAENKTESIADCYSQTHQAPHRYLAYKDIPRFIRRFVKGKQALDMGSGTGASTKFLYDLGLNVTGLDISFNMLEKARFNFPYLEFHHADDMISHENFDMVFSSFVLLELSSKQKIVRYLNKSLSFLKQGGIFIAITGSEHLYCVERNWMTLNANFEENSNVRSGDTVRLALKSPEMEFYDYYWKESDYLDCFKKVGLEVLKIHFPLGSLEDSYSWEDELIYSPFIVFIATKPVSSVTP